MADSAKRTRSWSSVKPEGGTVRVHDLVGRRTVTVETTSDDNSLYTIDDRGLFPESRACQDMHSGPLYVRPSLMFGGQKEEGKAQEQLEKGYGGGDEEYLEQLAGSEEEGPEAGSSGGERRRHTSKNIESIRSSIGHTDKSSQPSSSKLSELSGAYQQGAEFSQSLSLYGAFCIACAGNTPWRVGRRHPLNAPVPIVG
uniref:Uncharacterized protein n=1 Tax=Branchiostoma floridae TaxID=7739 RepID=C3Y9K4_BRAFL|eukprot:XP_002607250.1 hypothetical protein BRAFLDRAFT_88197 [Branchiostoma floridae]